MLLAKIEGVALDATVGRDACVAAAVGVQSVAITDARLYEGEGEGDAATSRSGRGRARSRSRSRGLSADSADGAAAPLAVLRIGNRSADEAMRVTARFAPNDEAEAQCKLTACAHVRGVIFVANNVLLEAVESLAGLKDVAVASPRVEEFARGALLTTKALKRLKKAQKIATRVQNADVPKFVMLASAMDRVALLCGVEAQVRRSCLLFACFLLLLIYSFLCSLSFVFSFSDRSRHALPSALVRRRALGGDRR